LPDAYLRERSLLWVMAAMILFMGIGSTVFTSRTENRVRMVLEQMQPPPMAHPVNAKIVEDDECPALTPADIKGPVAGSVSIPTTIQKVKAAR